MVSPQRRRGRRDVLVVEHDAAGGVLQNGNIVVLRVLCVSAVSPHPSGSPSRLRRRWPRGAARVRRVRTGFVHETEMSHLGHRRRGSERGSGARSENAGGISVAACSRSTVAASRGMPGFQAWNVEAGRRRQEKWAGGPGAQPGDIPASLAGSGADRGLAGAPERHFPVIFRVCGRFSDFPANFRSVSGGVRCLTMGHLCLNNETW